MVNTFKRNIRIGLGISLAALIISSTASYISIRKLLDSEQWVNHTTRVVQGLDNLLSGMKDAETGQRGFLLTGDPAFLDPYTNSRNDILQYFDDVQLLTLDNKLQQDDFPRLKSLIEQKYALIEETIAIKRSHGTITTSKLLEGKVIMDQIRKNVKLMVNREQQLMISRTSQMNRFAVYTPILILFTSLVAIIVTLIYYRKMQNNLLGNARIEEHIRQRGSATEENIKVISKMADQISKGDYKVRIKDDDF